MRWNRNTGKALWLLVILGLLASLPIAYERIQTEKSSKKVEMVFDYRDLTEIAAFQANPKPFITQQLATMKEAGITSMAVYESTLNELRNSRRIQLFNSVDAALLEGAAISANTNYTYLLFADGATEEKIQPIIVQAFESIGVNVKDWSYKGMKGLIIEQPLEAAVMNPLDPDPFALEMVKDAGFHIIVRLSDRRSNLKQTDIDRILNLLSSYNVKHILFDGPAVTGYRNDETDETITYLAKGMKERGIGIIAIERLKTPQEGFNKLAYLLDYNTVRLYSLPDQDAGKSVTVLSDRFQLAVKDRNIRMLFFNAMVERNYDKALILNPLDNIYESLSGPDGAISRIQEAGYTIGQAEAFNYIHSDWQRMVKLLIIVGAIALIALTIGQYVPILLLPIAVVGLIGGAGLTLTSPDLLSKALALGVGICAPTLAVILAVKSLRRSNKATDSFAARYGHAISLFLRTSLISIIAIPYVIGLMYHIKYMLVLDLFRGVSLLHALPILLIGLYIVLFTTDSLIATGKSLLYRNITLLWVVAAGIFGIAALYYLSRTGNAGQVSPIEMLFRSVLENTLGIRPRTKEFLLAHPILIAGAYISYRYRNAVYLFVFAIIGQLSMVDTFAHLHTPVTISIIRVSYGIVLGIILSIVYIAVWEIIARSWKRWSHLVTQ